MNMTTQTLVAGVAGFALMIGSAASAAVVFNTAVDNDSQFTNARTWVRGADPTVLDSVTEGELFPYVNDATEIYLCPIAADRLTPDTFPPSWLGDRLTRN